MSRAPADDQHRLLDVQELDTRIDQLAHQRRTTPQIAALAEVDARLEDLHTALVTSRTSAADLRRELKKAEADVEQVRTRAARDQSRLDSGAVSVKDVQALTSELTHLAARQSELEEVELDVMERLEAHEGALGAQQSAYDEVAAQQVQAREGLDAPLMALYEKLRGQLSGRGAGRLVGNRCEGCRMELNPMDLQKIRSAQADEVVRCEECGRILVRVP